MTYAGDPFRAELATWPDQFRGAPVAVGAPPRPAAWWFAGMGGSALAAEMAAARLPGPPALVLRDERLGEVPEGTGIVCVSCSGDTRETLAVWREAAARGLHRVAVASGGRLLEAARAEGVPHVRVPGELSPRASLGYLVRGVLAATGHPGTDAEWGAVAAHLEGVRDRWGSGGAVSEESLEAGPAEEMGWRLHARLPLVIAPDRSQRTAARRWVADLAENAKCPAMAWELPEASHNAVMVAAREAPRRLPCRAVVLGRPRSGEAASRWAALRELLVRGNLSLEEIDESHPDPWIEAVGLCYVGGWVSTAMAEIEGISAGSLSLMNDLKRALGPASQV